MKKIETHNALEGKSKPQNNVKGITSDQWEEEISKSEIPVFVDFWAPWCGPCRIIGPIVEELASEYSGKMKFVKVNIDENAGLASEYNIFSIPALAIFNKGKMISQQIGASPKAALKNMIEKML